MDQADSGDEIRVASGTYTDVHARAGITQVVYISKTVTIRGGYTTNFVEPPDAAATINNNQIFKNSATYSGGGLYLAGNDATVSYNTIANNRVSSVLLQSGTGGGIAIGNGSPLVSHNTVISNYASYYGGGVKEA